MRSKIRTARLIQLVGGLFWVFGVVSCTRVRDGEGGALWMGTWFLLGLVVFISARLYEWLSKE